MGRVYLTLIGANGEEFPIGPCTDIKFKNNYEPVITWSGDTYNINSGQELIVTLEGEFPMLYPKSIDYSGVYNPTESGVWGNTYSYPEMTRTSGYAQISVELTEANKALCRAKETLERRKDMISRKVFNEALAEAGYSKKDRRRVEKLSDSDFEYLIATLIARSFESDDLDAFESEVQKVKVVEDD